MQTARKSTLSATPARRQLAASTAGKASSSLAREVVDLCDSSDSSDDAFAGSCKPSPRKRPRLVVNVDDDDDAVPVAPSRAHPWVQRLVPSANNANRVTLGRGVNGGSRVATVTPVKPSLARVRDLPLPLCFRGSIAAMHIRRAKGPHPGTPAAYARAKHEARGAIDRLLKRRGKEELAGSVQSMRSDRRIRLDVTEILVEDRYRPLDLCSVFVDRPLPDSVEPQVRNRVGRAELTSQRIAQLRSTDEPVIAGRVKLQPVVIGALAQLSLATDRAHTGEHRVHFGVRGTGVDGPYELQTSLPLLSNGQLLEGPYFVALSDGGRIVGHARIARSYSATEAPVRAAASKAKADLPLVLEPVSRVDRKAKRRSRARSCEDSSSPIEWLPGPPDKPKRTSCCLLLL